MSSKNSSGRGFTALSSRFGVEGFRIRALGS